MKERLKKIRYVIEDCFRGIIGEITPEKKLVFIISMLLTGTLVNLYMTYRAVQGIGTDKSENTLDIRHIERPQVIRRDSASTVDFMEGGYDGME